MDNRFQLHQASHSDFDSLFDIYMHKKVNRFLNFEIMPSDQFKDIFHELMHSGQLMVFKKDQQIVATCVVIRQKRRVGHVATLGTLATHPEFHGQGIGTKFMHALFEKLRTEGIKRVDLYVEEDNPLAQNFYKKVGFQAEGVLKKYVKRQDENHYVDEHLMALFLD